MSPNGKGSPVPEAGQVSVVVPTFDRMDTLPEVLAALEQQADVTPFEVIVVDDGSGARTRAFLESWQRAAGGGAVGSRQVLRQQNAGPAAARNRGVEAASGRLVAFLGDDTVPGRGWLAAHLAAHERAVATGADPARTGVIGYTGWHERMRLDPFLRYINEYGLQFGYALIDDPDEVPFNFFYTSNLSVPREALLEEPFDEGFPYAAWEDIEVSYRLHRRGFRLTYSDRAVVRHDHPTDLDRFATRQEKAGYCAVVFYRRHPELGGFLGVGPGGPAPLPAEGRQRRIWWLVRTLQRWRVPLALPSLWEEALRYHYTRGLHRAWREGAGTDPVPDETEEVTDHASPLTGSRRSEPPRSSSGRSPS